MDGIETTDSSEHLKQYIELFFPGVQNEITRLCSSIHNEPIGYHHIDIMTELLGIDDVKVDTHSDIRIGYVFITSYYYLLDAVIDRHLSRKKDSVYLTCLISSGFYLYQRVVSSLAPKTNQQFCRLFFTYVRHNADGAGVEIEVTSDPLSKQEPYDTIVERANSFFFLYEFLALIYDKQCKTEVLEVLRNLAFFLQMVDDLTDWKKDFNGQRWTPLIRECFIGKGRVLSTPEMEYEMNNGFYNNKSKQIMDGLLSVCTKLNSIPDVSCNKLLLMIQKQIEIINTKKVELI